MPIERIVAGIDFGAPATDAARWAASHLAPAAELILVHVVDVPPLAPFARGAVPPESEVAASAADDARERLREVAATLPRAARAEVRVGRPHAELAAVARATRADLIVAGPHGNRTRGRTWLGTTAERLVRTSPVPVLVATRLPEGAPRRILVPVDDADITPRVLAAARQLARAHGAGIVVLHVLETAVVSHIRSMAAVTTRSAAAADETVERSLREEGLRWLERLAAEGIGPSQATAIVAEGNAGDAILAAAAERGTDLVVMGRRGSGRVLPALLGSTVGAVLHGAPCPVLVVTEPEDEIA